MSQAHTITVFGEVLADIFPEQSMLGGAPFNVARHLQAFALRSLLISRIGRDALGKRLLAAMRGYGMDTSAIQRDSRYPTGQVQVLMTGGEHRFDICDQQAYDYIEPDLPSPAWQGGSQLTYFGTLAQRHAQSRQALYALLQGSASLRFLDINLRLPWYEPAIIHQSLQHADIAKMNQDELAVIARMLQLPGNDPQAHALALLQAYQLQVLVITAGEQGAWQMGHDGSVVHAPLQLHGLARSKVVDTVGAGDAFAAVYILGTLSHWPVAQTLARANAFAGALCGVRGGVPDHDFYLPFLQQWRGDAPGTEPA